MERFPVTDTDESYTAGENRPATVTTTGRLRTDTTGGVAEGSTPSGAGQQISVIATTTPAIRAAEGKEVAVIGTRNGEVWTVAKLADTNGVQQLFAGTLGHLAQVSVTTSAAQVIAANAARVTGIIRAKAANTQPIYLGADGTVTATGAGGGIELSPGESLPLDGINGAIFAISASGTQVVCVGDA